MKKWRRADYVSKDFAPNECVRILGASQDETRLKKAEGYDTIVPLNNLEKEGNGYV